MRVLLAVLAIAACAIAHAQRIDGSGSNVRTPEPRPAPKSSKGSEGKKTAPLTVVRPAESDDRRAPEPKASSKPSRSTDALISVRPAPTPPSPAEQMQRRMADEQRTRRGEQANVVGRFRCNAYPVCDRSGGSYGTCRGVEEVYPATSWRDARQRVARDCAAVNNPDPCDCARQCSRVAQCGPV